MHTLEQLRRGECQGATRLKLSEQLTEFPEEIYSLADTLEVLDLSGNQLTDLPSDFFRLTKLKILFGSNNPFTHVPEVLGEMPELEMIGFKSCQIKTVSEQCLPAKTRWLILTDNRIETLPNGIGRLERLEKLMLAGNRLRALPDSFAQLHRLKLLRLAANQLQAFPDVLLTLPQLAWLAFSGNPFCAPRSQHQEFMQLPSSDIQCYEELGQGASGVISRATLLNNPHRFPEHIAIKIYKGEVTSDGYPADELDACLTAGVHQNLVTPLAHILEPDCTALVMDLIPADYNNLGQPPGLASCTRDTFTQGQSFNASQAAYIIEQMHDLVAHLEAKKVCHGDLYAHNVLINRDGHILFGDFGAASKYAHLSAEQQSGIRRIERRALTYFEQDILGLVSQS